MKTWTIFAATVLSWQANGQVLLDDDFEGYYITTNQGGRPFIDLDIEAIYNALNEENINEAQRVFRNGKNSFLDDQVNLRSLLSFSDKSKLVDFFQARGEFDAVFQPYRNYWQNKNDNYIDFGSDDPATYTKHLVEKYLSQSTNLSPIARRELTVKTLQYQTVSMYALYELAKGVKQCNENDVGASIKSWDEGWVYYTGSKLNATSAAPAGAGWLAFTLAERRANRIGDEYKQFLTRNEVDREGNSAVFMSDVNRMMFRFFMAGKSFLSQGRCQEAQQLILEINKQMLIPLIQGILEYGSVTKRQGGDKQRAEGWAFTLAALPQLHQADSGITERIRELMIYVQGAPDPIATVLEEEELRDLVIQILPRLGLTCEDIWNLGISSIPSDEKKEIVNLCNASKVILGYTLGSEFDVVKHSKVDLDIRDMNTALSNNNPSVAEEIFTKGRHSKKEAVSDHQPGMRHLAGLTRDWSSGSNFLPLGKDFIDYWTKVHGADYGKEYAKRFVLDALQNQQMDPVARKELAVKGAQFQSLWMYIVREMYSAVVTCRGANRDPVQIDDALHSWDEGWAFYAGFDAIKGESAGNSMYSLVLKRRDRDGFGNPAGGSKVLVPDANTAVLGLFEQGKTALAREDCDQAEKAMDKIVAKMTVPLLQGLFRYVYFLWGSDNVTEKHKAEGWAFAAALLPRIHKCNPSVGEQLKRAMEYPLPGPLNPKPLAKNLTALVQSTFGCLKVTCAEVGSVYMPNSNEPSTPPCMDQFFGHVDNSPVLSFYKSDTDVTEHSLVDRDIQLAKQLLKDKDYTSATNLYENGMHSRRSQGFRSVRSFTELARLEAVPLFKTYQEYFESNDLISDKASKDHSYADDFIQQALAKRGHFESATAVQREEGAVKGMQYLATYMYIVREMEDTLKDCGDGNLLSNDAPVTAWDEAVAFYVGSLVGSGGATSGAGMMHFTLAEKRAHNFNTYKNQIALANTKVLSAFAAGQLLVRAGACNSLRPVIEDVIVGMNVPLMQGLLRYAYKKELEDKDSHDKTVAEGWAFAAALLPQIDKCDPSVARMVRDNMLVSQRTMKDSFKSEFLPKVKSVMGCMGFGADELGNYEENESLVFSANAEGGSLDCNGSSGDSNKGLVAGIIVLAVLCAILLAYLVRVRCCRPTMEESPMHEINLQGDEDGIKTRRSQVQMGDLGDANKGSVANV